VQKAVNVSLSSFSRKYRLVTKQDFQSVFAKPRKIAYKYLLVLYQDNQKSYSRLGITVAKKRLKLAVDRNRFKRITRESFKVYKDLLKGLDIVVLIRSECTALCKRTGKSILRNDIDHLWRLLIESSKKV
jgi:ribonuclease P protein component